MKIEKLLFITMMSFTSGLLITPAMRIVAPKVNMIDEPNNTIKRHNKSIPYLGGLAIFIAFILGIIVSVLSFDITLTHSDVVLFINSTAMMIIGLIDDKITINYKIKFLCQIMIVLATIFFGIKINVFGNSIVDSVFSFFWYLGISNAINLIDIMDGLSSGTTIISCIFLCILAILSEEYLIALISVGLTGALLAFLIFNFNPASIFMGDCGSLFLGYIMSVMTSLIFWQNGFNSHFLIPIFLLFLPVFDVVFVSILRIYAGKSPFIGSPDHFALRINKRGLTVRQTVIIAYIISALFGILSLLSYKYNLILLSSIITVLFLWILVVNLLKDEEVNFLDIRFKL